MVSLWDIIPPVSSLEFQEFGRNQLWTFNREFYPGGEASISDHMISRLRDVKGYFVKTIFLTCQLPTNELGMGWPMFAKKS